MHAHLTSAPANKARSGFARVAAGTFLLASLVVMPIPQALADETAMRAGPTAAAEINHERCAGWSAEKLHAEFQALSQHELDLLVFRIADQASLTGLMHEN